MVSGRLVPSGVWSTRQLSGLLVYHISHECTSLSAINTMALPRIVLFGDSLTQRSFDPNYGYWGALLADKFQRICDVIPRGYSGYNTRYCKLIIEKVFSSIPSTEVACVTILLGSNDSSDPTSPTGQHVALSEYSQNLSDMINYLNSIGIGPERVILMCPPNYFHDKFVSSCLERGTTVHVKNDQQVKEYAQTCQVVANSLSVTCLNLYDIFSNHPNSESLFMDGLHFSSLGAQLLYDHLIPLVVQKVEHFAGQPLEKLIKFPIWSEIDCKNPENSFNSDGSFCN